MGKSIKISPIKKTYVGEFKTLERSLGEKGMVRAPGTFIPLTPRREADGRYRTGLDKTALYIKRLSPEEQAAEIALIDSLLKQLNNAFGDGVDFGPRSNIWQAYSEEPVKVTPIRLGNEPVILNIDIVPQDLLNYCWVRIDPRIARSIERLQECPTCQYYIENEEAENRIVYQKKVVINRAIVAFDALSPTKKRQVARLLGLPISDNTSEEAIYNMIDTYLHQPTSIYGKDSEKNPITLFNDIMALSDERVYAKDQVEQAIRHNIYREAAGGKILEGSLPVGDSRDDLVNYLLDPVNQKDLLALEKRIKAKKIASE